MENSEIPRTYLQKYGGIIFKGIEKEKNLIDFCTVVILTGILGSSFPPPTKVPFWKLKGYTCFPNLWSRSLFHAMFFLLTFSSDLPRIRVYVSLNKLHAIKPQGTIGRPLLDSWGLQELVSLYPNPCKSCRSFLLLTYLKIWNHLGKTIKLRSKSVTSKLNFLA